MNIKISAGIVIAYLGVGIICYSFYSSPLQNIELTNREELRKMQFEGKKKITQLVERNIDDTRPVYYRQDTLDNKLNIFPQSTSDSVELFILENKKWKKFFKRVTNQLDDSIAKIVNSPTNILYNQEEKNKRNQFAYEFLAGLILTIGGVAYGQRSEKKKLRN